MNALIIGADNLDSIQYKLKEKGFDNIYHISGRNGWHKKLRSQLNNVNLDLIIILVDYINHNVVYNIKRATKNLDVKTIFSKRSWVHLENHINDFVEINNMLIKTSKSFLI